MATVSTPSLAATPKRSGKRDSAEIECLVERLLRQVDRPLTAYEIVELAARYGHSIVPMQVYRTMARLSEQGRVLRLESVKAYLLAKPGTDLFLVCGGCKAVKRVSMPSLSSALSQLRHRASFRSIRIPVEVHGECNACRDQKDRQSAVPSIDRIADR
ncbi:transcriptional repressor [Porphyrobacter algicida]|uniref:Transcriptional repressor n=1 Tax=Qipengyuania algicida TaxID=1836209 RepID=A0A845AFX2_9SPHN|nr:transcriptional repressor [Qipengyuania algicida]MXP29452.1 transcriptional repressor [Qipengyuania algicida]